ncbi:hypothetical protein GCM10020229_11990 [Kitasatospora albolonga]
MNARRLRAVGERVALWGTAPRRGDSITAGRDVMQRGRWRVRVRAVTSLGDTSTMRPGPVVDVGQNVDWSVGGCRGVPPGLATVHDRVALPGPLWVGGGPFAVRGSRGTAVADTRV